MKYQNSMYTKYHTIEEEMIENTQYNTDYGWNMQQ